MKHEVIVISPATYDEIVQDNLEGGDIKLKVHTIVEKLPDFQGSGILEFRKHIRYIWIWFKKIVDKTIQITDVQPDLVFFSTIDPFIGPYTSKYEIDIIFPYRWSGLYMKPQNIVIKWQYSFLRKSLLNPNHLLRSRRCNTIGIFVKPLAENLYNVIKKPVITFPDIVDNVAPDLKFHIINKIVDKANGRTIVSLVGSLDKRKGIINLLMAAERLPKDKFFFVFAGQLSKSSFSESELFLIDNSKLSNAYFYFERIDDEPKFNALISISNIIYAAYIDFQFSSNLIGKAALYYKPLLTTSGTYMADLVEKYKLGEIVNSTDVEDIYNKLLNMQSVDYVFNYQSSNRCNSYNEENSYPVFREKLKQLLRFN
ncbi:MAG: glycosyltransferase [Pelobium sp.]